MGSSWEEFVNTILPVPDENEADESALDGIIPVSAAVNAQFADSGVGSPFVTSVFENPQDDAGNLLLTNLQEPPTRNHPHLDCDPKPHERAGSSDPPWAGRNILARKTIGSLTQWDLSCLKRMISESCCFAILMHPIDPLPNWPQNGPQKEEALRAGFFVGKYSIGSGISFNGPASNDLRPVENGFGISKFQSSPKCLHIIRERFHLELLRIAKVILWSAKSIPGWEAGGNGWLDKSKALYIFEWPNQNTWVLEDGGWVRCQDEGMVIGQN